VVELKWALAMLLARRWSLAAHIAGTGVTHVTRLLPDLDYSFPGPGYIIDIANKLFLSVKYQGVGYSTEIKYSYPISIKFF
jgi:hypothetical protein